MVGTEITVTVMGVRGSQVRLGVNAPKNVAVQPARSTFGEEKTASYGNPADLVCLSKHSVHRRRDEYPKRCRVRGRAAIHLRFDVRALDVSRSGAAVVEGKAGTREGPRK
jgi:carbon storage regulator CsrA